MLLKKTFITFVMFFTLLGLSETTIAKEAKISNAELLVQVDTKIQAALDAIPAGDEKAIATLIKEASEIAGDLSASYKYEFERDKANIKLKNSRNLIKKSDFSGAEQELKNARELFTKLPSFE